MSPVSLLRGAVAALPAALVAACTAAPAGGGMNDPYEPANRMVHEFNKGLDTALLRPAGRVAAQLPEAVRLPIGNFADNVGLPGTVVNNLLQGDIGGAAQNTLRFVVNSTVGVLGLADPAGGIGLTEVETDFGATLAAWGVPEGAYLELPFLGPSTERDAVGEVVDMFIDPLEGLGLNAQLGDGAMARYGLGARAGDLVIQRGMFGGTLDSVLYDSADSYAQARLLYLQNRRFELGTGGGDAYLDPYAPDAAADPYAAGAFVDPYAEGQ